jgi:hypothetical protein
MGRIISVIEWLHLLSGILQKWNTSLMRLKESRTKWLHEQCGIHKSVHYDNWRTAADVTTVDVIGP